MQADYTGRNDGLERPATPQEPGVAEASELYDSVEDAMSTEYGLDAVEEDMEAYVDGDVDIDYDGEDIDTFYEDMADTFEETVYDTLDDLEDYLEDVEGPEQVQYVGLDEEDGRAVLYDVEIDEEDGELYADIAVKFAGLSDGLFGFTNTQSDHVVVNDSLYRIDQEETIRHEKLHQRFPWKDELQIRYLNGDLDPENTNSGAGGTYQWSEDDAMQRGPGSGYGCC